MEAEDVPHIEKTLIKWDWWRIYSENRAGRLLNLLAHPLSGAYAGCGTARRKLYSSRILSTKRLPCTVISVGNLTMGGTGKTPAAISIARTLTSKGIKTAIISRGYRSKHITRTAIVSDGKSILMGPSEAGDEPYMMARALQSVPVIVGKDRYSAGLLAWEEFSAQAIILDDGYQQLALVKDLNILLMNWQCAKEELRLFPLGCLRESLSQAERADIIVFTTHHGDRQQTPPLATRKEIPSFRGEYRATGLRRLEEHALLPIEEVAGKNVLAFCGIARPRSFLETLRQVGARVVEFHPYPDHYHFSPKNFLELRERARASGAEMLITTEKDEVKIEGLASGEPLIYALLVELVIAENKNEWEWYLLGRIKE